MSVQALNIGRQIVNFIRQDCEMRRPEEACGLLVGKYLDSVVEVSDVMPVRNQSMSEVRFSIDPIVMFKAFKKAEENGETIVGVYHSHPHTAEPSPLDTAYMTDTSYVWIIVDRCRMINAFVYDNEVKKVKVEEV